MSLLCIPLSSHRHRNARLMAVVCFPRSRDELQVCRRGFTEALRRTEMLVGGVEGEPWGNWARHGGFKQEKCTNFTIDCVMI